MKNDDITKTSFPGYEIAQEKQELERAKKEKIKQEKRLNTLPPFLMVRSGLFNEAILLAMVLIPVSEYIVTKQPSSFTEFLRGCCYVLPTIAPIIKYFCLLSEREILRHNLKNYANHDEDNLSPISDYKFKVMAKILVQHKSKLDSRMFERMMQNPESIDDIKTASAIIFGHLKSHPDDAQMILDKFTTNTIPPELQKRLKELIEKQK